MRINSYRNNLPTDIYTIPDEVIMSQPSQTYMYFLFRVQESIQVLLSTDYFIKNKSEVIGVKDRVIIITVVVRWVKNDSYIISKEEIR